MRRHTVFVKLELLFRAPDVSAVKGNVDRNIAYQANALAVSVGFNIEPLMDEGVLNEFPGEEDTCISTPLLRDIRNTSLSLIYE